MGPAKYGPLGKKDSKAWVVPVRGMLPEFSVAGTRPDAREPLKSEGRQPSGASMKSVFRQVCVLGAKIPPLACRFTSGRLWKNPVSRAIPEEKAGWYGWGETTSLWGLTSGFTVSFRVSVFLLRITARKKPPFLRVAVRV